MKRKSSATTDLRAFLARAAAKKKDIVAPSSNEREMQLVIFQGQIETSNATPAEQERVEPEPPIIVDAEDNDDFESMHLNGTASSVIDRQLVELNNRFDEVNIELLRCMASFNPSKNFDGFSTEKLVKLAGFYPQDFEFEEKARPCCPPCCSLRPPQTVGFPPCRLLSAMLLSPTSARMRFPRRDGVPDPSSHASRHCVRVRRRGGQPQPLRAVAQGLGGSYTLATVLAVRPGLSPSTSCIDFACYNLSDELKAATRESIPLPSLPPLKSCRPPPAVRSVAFFRAPRRRLSPQPLLSIDETLLTRHGAIVVVGDLSTAGATEAGHAAGALGEEQRLAQCGVPRCLRCRKGDEHGVDALGDGVTAPTPSTLLYGALTPASGMTGIAAPLTPPRCR
ncbi:hypothetical protein ZEAMMB73_Zm00001d041425 [Zea mays]|uniref:Uncharacterized protein n=1 Tax=Zea mays TaxID=4577 RepID=A0A1D6MW09_MAIZE|nr:hypothetical protein ZEAMMB73_Zm00001d041425 [Zea mays]